MREPHQGRPIEQLLHFWVGAQLFPIERLRPAGALRYYAALDAYFKEKMPIFYEREFKPWYDAKVKPDLG